MPAPRGKRKPAVRAARPRNKSRLNEEPECLTISSDDEAEERKHDISAANDLAKVRETEAAKIARTIKEKEPILTELFEEVPDDERKAKFATRSSKLVNLARARIHSKSEAPCSSKPSSILSQKRHSKERVKNSSSTSIKKDKMGQTYSSRDIKPITNSDNVRLVPDNEPTVLDEATRDDSPGPAESLEATAARIQSVIDGKTPGCYMMFDCRNVRIGSMRTTPREKVVLSTAGLRITVPPILNDDSGADDVVIIIRLQDISRMLVFVNRSMPVMFLYCTVHTGKRVSAQLKMDPNSGPYYCPVGPDVQRRIVMLPARLPEDSKAAIFTILGDKIREVSNMEANTLLIRCSSQDAITRAGAVTRAGAQDGASSSAGAACPVRKQELQSPFFTVIRRKLVLKQIMTYPPPPAPGGISINTEDYSCLGGMMFLNDIIIDFYLNYLTREVLSEEDRERTHVFSTFFYKRLTTRPKKNRRSTDDDVNLTAAEKRHARVKSWTKKVNIFEKDFIIVPINESAHWFMAVICFPGLMCPVSAATGSPIAGPNVPPAKQPRANRAKLEAVVNLDEAGSDRDEAEGDEDDELGTSDEEESVAGAEEADPSYSTAPADSKTKETKGAKAKTISEAIKQPCILIFDSLQGVARSRVTATLRDYLTVEYKAKYGTERSYTSDVIKGSTPKVPQQNNFFDCGLFLLQYAESFFQKPIEDYKIPIRSIKTWFDNKIVAGKREEIANLLLQLMKSADVDIPSLQLPELDFFTPDMDHPNMLNGEEIESKHAVQKYSTVTTLRVPKEERIVKQEVCEPEMEEEEEAPTDNGMEMETELENVETEATEPKRIRVK